MQDTEKALKIANKYHTDMIEALTAMRLEDIQKALQITSNITNSCYTLKVLLFIIDKTDDRNMLEIVSQYVSTISKGFPNKAKGFLYEAEVLASIAFKTDDNELLEKAAKKLKMKLQYELSPGRTGTDADRMRYTGTGVPVALVSLPLRYMHSPVETVSYKDIDQEIDLLVEMIVGLTGKENLKPLED